MTDASVPSTPAASAARASRSRRALLWAALVLLLLVAQTLLVALTVSYESSRTQEEAETAVAHSATEIRRDLMRTTQALQAMSWSEPAVTGWRNGANELLRAEPALLRVERRDVAMRVQDAIDSPFGPRLFTQMPRANLELDSQLACSTARRSAAPMFSRTFFVPLPEGQGVEVLDLCVPVQLAGRDAGFLVGTFALAQLLEDAMSSRQLGRHELTFVEGDGTRLARAGMPRGLGVYRAERVLDLPGVALQLRADSATGRPSLIPNLTTALVLGLSIALFGVVWVLARDVRRRAAAERALAESLAYRKAMEDSLVTGLRARDLKGVITYVNPAFCAMVGFTAEEMNQPQPPYWPPEEAQEYMRRQQARLAAGLRDPHGKHASREGFETVFMRKSGERFAVMIYEAPLVDGDGRHTGWMSAVLDVSAQRGVEELSRQQQDRLQAAARLATVGEMASLLSHELNQPLAAIASYASGSLNLIEAAAGADGATGGPAAGAEMAALLGQALTRIAEQAERAGRIIKSVHGFVRRREQHRETIAVDLLIDAVMPLVRLQARKSGTRIEVDLPAAPARMPRVVCDRTMIEQVLLNLSRNGIQAMESDTVLAARVLTIRVRQTHARWVTFSVIDAGPGIAPEVAAQLFTPFFTTRAEGMGLGLSLCRTVIEQHGGALDFGPPAGPEPAAGTEFRFTLPAPRSAEAGAEPAA